MLADIFIQPLNPTKTQLVNKGLGWPFQLLSYVRIHIFYPINRLVRFGLSLCILLIVLSHPHPNQHVTSLISYSSYLHIQTGPCCKLLISNYLIHIRYSPFPLFYKWHLCCGNSSYCRSSNQPAKIEISKVVFVINTWDGNFKPHLNWIRQFRVWFDILDLIDKWVGFSLNIFLLLDPSTQSKLD